MLNTLQLCGIEHTCFRGTKRLVTAEAQMEHIKLHAALPAVAASLGVRPAVVPQCFANPHSHSVQDFAFFCTKTSDFACLVQDLPISCTKRLVLLVPSRFGPLTCSFSGNFVVPSRFGPSTCSFCKNLVDPYRILPFSVRNV